MVENNQKHHAIVLPMPYQGHVNPAIHLSINLASRGFTVTFVNTELIDSLIIKARRGTATAPTGDIFTQARNSGLDIRYTTISDGFPLGFDRTRDAHGFMMGMMYVFSAHVDELVKKLAGLEPPPTCLIADSFYAWPSIIASKYNLVSVSFFTEPALVFAIDSHLDLLKENGHFGCKDCRKDSIDYIPGVEAIEPRDLPLYFQENNTTSAVYLTVYKGFEDAKRADIVICNTVQELEPQTISALEEKQPFYAIGPLFPQSFTEQTAFRSLLPESDCSKWLDSKPPGSVLYASFGSLAHLTQEHIMEIGRGLMLSEVNFIWVLRPGMAITDDETDFSMDGFQECVRDRGLIVPWCDQPAVISHPTVGGFMTHCGWNSILESIWCGVPMICFPFIVDQPTNRKLVVDEWKIGINLCNEDDKSMSKEVVASKVKFLMKAESSIELRKAIKDVRKNLENALASNGSSVKNGDKFVEKIKAKFNQLSVRNRN
nr:UDP-glycosyltransferase 86A1-like [Ipomoea batatas]